MSWSFESLDLKEVLNDLKPSTVGQWGRMSAQQMVEHLTHVLRIANGKEAVTLYTPEDKLERMVAFLRTDKPFPREFKAPFLPEDPIPVRHPNLWTAIEALEAEVSYFKKHYENAPEKTETHPTFGPLNRDEWVLSQNKHFKHHFEQFGIQIH
jgi:oxepin-CoA hydrolase / 3-oxo-5,6-dehydrosuberyl-CoA semialdehyde dehydrogenase